MFCVSYCIYFAESKLRRQEETKRDLLKTHPSEAERELIHEKFLQTLDPKYAKLWFFSIMFPF